MTNVCPIDSDTRHVTYLYDGESRPYAGVYASGEATPVAFGIATTDRGDVRELTDISGTPFAFYAYDAYGMPLAADGTATASVDATLAATIAGANVLRYAGYCFDEHSGMYYLSQRYYDPATCQFITKDPAKADGEESAYQYCGGDPVGKVDPSGYLAVPSWMKSAYSMAGRLVRAYLGINSQERAAIKRNPTAGIVYVYWCYRALASERMFFGTMGAQDNKADAFRHVFLAANLYRWIGRSLARVFQAAHEGNRSYSSSTTAGKMDYLNNTVGYALAWRYGWSKWTAEKTVRNTAFSAVRSRKVYYMRSGRIVS